jgi:hypothetical protein
LLGHLHLGYQLLLLLLELLHRRGIGLPRTSAQVGLLQDVELELLLRWWEKCLQGSR